MAKQDKQAAESKTVRLSVETLAALESARAVLIAQASHPALADVYRRMSLDGLIHTAVSFGVGVMKAHGAK